MTAREQVKHSLELEIQRIAKGGVFKNPMHDAAHALVKKKTLRDNEMERRQATVTSPKNQNAVTNASPRRKISTKKSDIDVTKIFGHNNTTTKTAQRTDLARNLT